MKNNFQKLICTTLAVFLLLLQFTGFIKSVNADSQQTLDRAKGQLQKTVDYFHYYGQSTSDWDALALYLSKRSVSTRYISQMQGVVEEDRYPMTTDLARVIVGWTAAGKNATDVHGINLIEKLHQRITQHPESQKINDLIWSLIALDTRNYLSGIETSIVQEVYQDTVNSDVYDPPELETNIRQVIIDRILSMSLSTGGWSFSGNSIDPDMTGMALSALAPYNTSQNPAVQAKVNLAVSKLMTFRPLNSNSIAQMIIGFSSIGLDKTEVKKWVEDLLQFSLANGQFSYKVSDKGNHFATQQSLFALVAYQRLVETGNGLIYQNMTGFLPNENRPDQPPLNLNDQSEQGNIVVRVEGPDSLITKGRVNANNALDALVEMLTAKNLNYDIIDSPYGGKFLTSIGSIETGSYGGYDGWGFAVIRDGVWISPDVGMGSFDLTIGDEVVVFYDNPDSSFNSIPYVHSIEIEPQNPTVGTPITVTVTQGQFKYAPVTYEKIRFTDPAVGVKVQLGNNSAITDNEGKVTFASSLPVGQHQLIVSNYQVGIPPKIVRAEQTVTVRSKSGDSDSCTVKLSVTGYNGDSIFPTTSMNLENMDTPYSVLIRALDASQVDTSYESGIYVRSINGLAEFDKGPGSGWMFAVNREFLKTGAEDINLHCGDSVEWRYTLNFGADLEQGMRSSSNGGPSSLNSVVSLQDLLTKVNITVNNLTPITKAGKVITVTNNLEGMSTQKIQELIRTLQSNQVEIAEKVTSGQESILTDIQQELKLVIPANALQESKTISIREQTPDNRNELISSIYEFGPKGTQFQQPVAITIKIPLTMEDLEQLALVWLNEETNEWIPIPAVVNAKEGTITGYVNHFTKFTVIDRSKLQKTQTIQVTDSIQSSSKHILLTGDLSDWEAFALSKADQQLPTAYLSSVEQKFKDQHGSFHKITDYQRMVLGILSAGGDPTNFGGYNIIEKIYNNDRMTLQGTNGIIFALIALDSGNFNIPASAKWNRVNLIEWLLEQQNSDGGWSLAPGESSSVDITAMCLVALAPYREQSTIANSVDLAIRWLSSKQLETGGYSENGVENCESVAQVIQGLTAIGIDPAGNGFTKSNDNLVTNLLSFQLSNGGFAHDKGQTEANAIATEQALAALVAYDWFVKGKGSIYSFSDNHYLDEALISPWARHAVGKAREYKIMGGVSSTAPQFAPKELLTRAQFATLMSAIMREKPTSPSKQIFADVIPNSWYDGYVTKAYEKGWMKGVSPARFEPNKPITRQEMAVIVANALKLDPQSSLAIRDLSQAKAYAQTAIQTVYENQLMVGHNGSFQPQAKVTREMAAVVAVQIFKKVNQAE